VASGGFNAAGAGRSGATSAGLPFAEFGFALAFAFGFGPVPREELAAGVAGCWRPAAGVAGLAEFPGAAGLVLLAGEDAAGVFAGGWAGVVFEGRPGAAFPGRAGAVFDGRTGVVLPGPAAAGGPACEGRRAAGTAATGDRGAARPCALDAARCLPVPRAWCLAAARCAAPCADAPGAAGAWPAAAAGVAEGAPA